LGHFYMSQRIKITLAATVLSLLSSTAIAETRGLAGSYLAGRQATFLSDYSAASTYYTRALSRDQSNPFILDQAMMAYIGTGDIEGAAQIANQRGDRSGNPIAEVTVKAAAIAKGDYSKSIDPVTEEEGLAPLLNGLLRGWSMLGQGNMSDASNVFAQVAETADFSSFARYHEALALATVGDFVSAEGIFSGETHGPLQLSVRGFLAHAQTLVQLERNDDAIALLEAALSTRFDAHLDDAVKRLTAGESIPYEFVRDAKDGSAEVLFNIAAILNGRAAPEIVLSYARLAQHIRPDHAPAVLTVAETLEDLDQHGLATKAFAQVDADDPAYFIAEMGRADALYADDRKDAAAEVLEALTKSHGDMPLVHASLGDLLSRLQRYDEALDAYGASLALRDDDDRAAWRVYYARGIMHENLDNFPDMEGDFRKALELYPNQPDVLNYLGYSLVEQNLKLDEALGMIETAVKERPESGYITDSLAWVYYRLGRFDEAVEPMERAVELLPVDPIVNDHLGDVYWKVGRVLEAEFQWKRALSFEPEEKDADRIRRKLDVGLDVVLEDEAVSGGGDTTGD
jgi:tetratricopeptide (TPR) repeat protein